MAVKETYGIPTSLDASALDMDVSLQSKDGIGPGSVPVRVILFFLLSLGILAMVMTNSFVRQGDVWQIVCFVVLWMAITATLAGFDATGHMQVEFVPVLADYLPQSMRTISCRRRSRAFSFGELVGIVCTDKEVPSDSRIPIPFMDGTYGYFYAVVGSASRLLFDDDRDAILERVETFWRKIDVDGEMSIITKKEAQRVDKQLGYLVMRRKRLTVSDPDLDRLASLEFDALNDYVGRQFRSTHQYLMLKAPTVEALQLAEAVLRSEAENSTMMFKRCSRLSLTTDESSGLGSVTDLVASIFDGEA